MEEAESSAADTRPDRQPETSTASGTETQPDQVAEAASSSHARDPESEPAEAATGALDENTAIVLIHSDLVSLQDLDSVQTETAAPARDVRRVARPATAAAGGIQLPGFVRRQAREIKRSLRAEPRAASHERSLALVAASDLDEALSRAQQHWQEVWRERLARA